MGQQGREQRRAQPLAARGTPAGAGIGQIGVVLERHLQSQRQTAKAVTDPFRGQLQRIGVVLAGGITKVVLKVRTGGLEVFNEAGLRARLRRRGRQQGYLPPQSLAP